MAGYVLHLKEEEQITLAGPVVRRLIDGGNGDAALLYLCLVRDGGAAAPEKLCERLRWSETRLRAAEAALGSMGLVSAPERAAETAPAPPEDVTPEYSREDVMRTLEGDASFAALLVEVERKLGKLSDPSVRKLLGLYEHLGLPADVIYLLVNHCLERKRERFGVSRPPTMREVEQEGYRWARLELFSTAAASAYLREEQRRRARYPEYMRALGLGDRAAAPSEERYLAAWLEMGFPPESVALAYDRTVLQCHEFKWPYCNGILKKWHEKGLHTPEEVRGERTGAQKSAARGGKNAWMRQYD